MSPPRRLRASCLCRQITIFIEDTFVLVGYCHCSECQKFSGSSCAAFGRIERTKVVFETGEELIEHYHKTPTGRVAFCRCCGSSLYNGQQDGEFINIRLGILDDDPSARPSIRVYCDSMAPWDQVTDTLPQFATIP